MTSKDAFFLEMKYGLCASGKPLDGKLAQDNIDMDVRAEPPEQKDPDKYLQAVFSRPVRTEQSDINHARDRVDLEIIGLQGIDGKDDDLVEEVGDIVQDHFQGKHKTIGQFDDNGTPNSSKGVKARITLINRTDRFSDDLEEKIQILQFALHHVRG